jgi:hypothetical protein
MRVCPGAAQTLTAQSEESVRLLAAMQGYLRNCATSGRSSSVPEEPVPQQADYAWAVAIFSDVFTGELRGLLPLDSISATAFAVGMVAGVGDCFAGFFMAAKDRDAAVFGSNVGEDIWHLSLSDGEASTEFNQACL